MFPVDEVAGFLFAEEFVADEGLDEALAEEFGERARDSAEAAGRRWKRPWLSKSPLALRMWRWGWKMR